MEELKSILNRVDNVLKTRDKIDALSLYEEIIKLLPQIEKQEINNVVYLHIYLLLELLEKNEDSLKYLDLLREQNIDYYFKYKGYLEKGLCLMRLNRKIEGISALFDTLTLTKNNNDYNGCASVIHFIAMYYYEIKDCEKALEYYNEAIFYARKSHNKPLESKSFYRIGCIYFLKGKYNLALETLREAEDLAVDCRDLFHVYQAAIKRCLVYLKLENIKEVHKIIESISQINEPVRN